VKDHDCPCGACRCPNPAICKNKDCKKNYAILLTADWCPYCPQMYPIFKELEDAGYIVYTLNYDKLDKNGRKLAGRATLPATIIIDAGVEADRFTGVTSAATIKAKLKTRKQQDGTPDSGGFDYDLRGQKEI